MPTVVADVSFESHVMLTWKIRMKALPPRIRSTPSGGKAASACHHAGLLAAATPECFDSCSTVPSRMRDATSAVRADTPSFRHAISDTGMVPRRQLLLLVSSLTAFRSVVMEHAPHNGVSVLTSMGTSGADRVWEAEMPTSMVPSVESTTAADSRRPSLSPLTKYASTAVQRRSVDCMTRWVPVGTSCRPQFVTANFRPKTSPVGPTWRSLYPKCGPKIHERSSPALALARCAATVAAARARLTQVSCRKAVAMG
mmetsp:Transcript_48301/g.127543  ORF Transcript_48301/g.127543 Transcript_48301/m.127543 type:complete len:255 (+) Transcript_48301:281-1045(+)